MPALPASDELASPGTTGVDDAKMVAAAVPAAEAAVILVGGLLIYFHARLLRCMSAKLTRRVLAARVACVPGSVAP